MKWLLPSLLLVLCSGGFAADWPQWMGDKRDGIYREDGVIDSIPAAGLKSRWRVAIGSGYAGPAAAKGRVFVLDRKADSKPPGKDQAKPGRERLLCLDLKSGDEIWRKEWDAPYLIDYGSGPRATPTVVGDVVYVLGAEGFLRCLKTADGAVVWERELKKEYQCSAPTWGFSAAPVVWDDYLLCTVGGRGSACVAFDRHTGKERWRGGAVGQVGYCPPLPVEHHGRKDVILWTGDAILAFALKDGKELWKIPWTIQYGVSIANPVQRGDTVLVSNFWTGCKLLKLKQDGSEPDLEWESEGATDTKTKHLNALMCTPMPRGEFVYGVCSYGHLRCLNWQTGERKWETLEATSQKVQRYGHAFLTKIGDNGDRWFLFNERGELILAELTPQGYKELGRAPILKPDNHDCGRPVVWSHPAYADKALFARNDSEIVCMEIGK